MSEPSVEDSSEDKDRNPGPDERSEDGVPEGHLFGTEADHATISPVWMPPKYTGQIASGKCFSLTTMMFWAGLEALP